ncbi:MAG TPA: phosphate acyltransferase PlsX [Kofleriaceae bacterium]|jgi:glycerol-3-phosphate acyltransferase PlsX
MDVVVDAMGSDHAPGPEVAGAIAVVRASDSSVTLVGPSDVLDEALARAGRTPADRIRVVHATQAVAMTDHAAAVYRSKPDSSMRRGCELVARGEGDAFVSAGNSGAILACALFAFKRIPGVDRPAIATVIPTPAGPLVLCDSGANVEPKAAQLAQFGVLAAAYDRAVHHRERPRLGLLANGGEASKGTQLTRDAHALLAAARGSFEFLGYVEGSELFRGTVDAIATDGFTGNVVLKTCEGIAEGLFGLVKEALQETALARLGGALVAPALRGLAKKIDYHEIGGALLAGVAKPCVIAHGRSDGTALASAIRTAARFAAAKLPEALGDAMHALKT